MEVAQAFEVLGLEADAPRAEVERTYREIRKPLLKQLNRHNEGEEPEGLVKMLESVETAFRVITATPHTPPASQSKEKSATDAAQKKSTGRVGMQPGAVIMDRYEVRGLVSHRPEGDTYRVHDRVRDVPLALKVIDAGLLRNARQRARLHQGVIAATRMNHPNLARVLDIVRLQHTLAVLQELPAGDNLWELMYGADELRAKLTQDVVHKITEQASHALAYLHTAMPHATLRPESVWVDDDGNVKISDFGLADLQRPLRDKRMSRAKLGTAYWAPEQYRDDVAVDARSDQYALALMLYEILSGKPSVGRTASVRSFRRDYPRRFTAALERGLSSKSPQRFADMDEFGYAAIPAYRTEQAALSGVTLQSILVPALVLIGLFAAFVVSPFGTQGADAIGEVVGRWHAAQDNESAADLELRQLVEVGNRLHAQRESLDEGSQEELTRVRDVIAAGGIDTADREQARHDLTQVVRQLVDTSRRGAEAGVERTTKVLDAFEALRAPPSDAADAVDAAEKALSSAAAEERHANVVRVVYLQAGAARRKAFWRAQRDKLLALTSFATAYRALLEAEAALAIGDEAATGQAYDIAAAQLVTAAESSGAVVQAVESFDPFDSTPGIATKMEASDCKECMTAWFGEPTEWTEDDDLARVLKGLWAEAADTAGARWLISRHGYWALEATIGPTNLNVGGTWDDDTGARRMHITVVNNAVLEQPLALSAQRGDQMPSLSDLRAALAAVPRSTYALWSRQASEASPLPEPSFDTPDRILRSLDIDARGTFPEGSEACCVLVNGRRAEATDGTFAVPVRVPGDALRTWIRAHAARGLRSGSAAWMHVRSDGLKPRVELLSPKAGSALKPGDTVSIRAFAYDSNLETLEVAGKEVNVRRDDVYTMIEHEITVPASGPLEIPVRAVDAAGNEFTDTWRWTVR